MIVLDENMPEDQRLVLRGWRIRARQIGHEVGRAGMSDTEIVSLIRVGHDRLAVWRHGHELERLEW